jgi:type III pantothenate kinase
LVNDKINLTTLLDLWQQIPTPHQMIVSCVSAIHLLEQVQKAAIELWPSINIVLVTALANRFGVINSYQQPEKLGVDRWLAMIAARKQYQGAVCVVDCGTAITIDLLAADGRHQGGFIAPGLTLMKKSLAKGTQALQHVTESYIFEPANNTDAAIYCGTLAACCGLIKYVLSKQPQNIHLVLTGGDAVAIADQLAIVSTVDGELILHGLLCVAEEV